MKLIFCFAIILCLNGCSIYQSDGRKFLENEGLEFASQSVLKKRIKPRNCEVFAVKPDELMNSEYWNLSDQLPELNADVFVTESSGWIAMAVDRWITPESEHFICLFEYQSAANSIAMRDADLAWALEQPAEFLLKILHPLSTPNKHY